MKLNELKEIFDKELGAAKEKLEALGLTALPTVEVQENALEGGESEVVSVLATLAVSAEGLSEEDLLYICMSEDPDEAGEFDGERCEEDVRDFRAHVELLAERAGSTENKAEAVRAVCREIDREVAEKYQAELDKMNASVKKNLKIAIVATVALLAVAAVCIVIKVVLAA